MRISEIIPVLEAELVYGDDLLQIEIGAACGSDMMSDVLAFSKERNMVLLTGLINGQAVRTADMLDMRCIVFVRGKKPGEDILELAKERNIALLSTSHTMYTACGKLYAAGLSGGEKE